MKHVVRFQNLLVPEKLRIETKITIDGRVEYTSNVSDPSTSVRLYPWVLVSLIKTGDVDESGIKVKSVWNPNDSLGLTTYTVPIFTEQLAGIQQDLKTPELYQYTGTRLELNETVASKVRRVFMVGNTTVEFTAVVITQADETKVEGIKIKFNNEQSTTLLTLNDLESIVFTLKNLSTDTLAFMMYTHFLKSGSKSKNTTMDAPVVDILPLFTPSGDVEEFK